MSNSGRSMNWWMDLFTTYTHNLELQALTTLSLTSILYKLLHAKSSPAYSVFTSRCLVTALNNGDFSVSVLTSLRSGEYPTIELLDEIYRHPFSASLAELNSTQLSSFWDGVRTTLRRAVYRQSVRLGAKLFETHDQYYFSTEHLLLYSLCNISLTRKWVCRLQLQLVLASAVILGSESSGTHDHVLL
jgi:hypothetical protein